MHTAALAELGLAADWSYKAIEVTPADFEARVRAMAGEGFVGANVTVPHKGAALALADSLSETAREIGAANTLSFADGEIGAENTDAAGLLAALPARRGGGGLWCSAPGAPLARSSGRCCARGPRSRSGTAPSCAHATSATTSAVNPSALLTGTSVDRQLDRGRAHGEDPFEQLPLQAGDSRQARSWSTWSTAASPVLCCPPPPRRRRDRRRDRDSGPPGGAVAGALDRDGGAVGGDALAAARA